jgi:hypothetical protein
LEGELVGNLLHIVSAEVCGPYSLRVTFIDAS